MGRDAAITAEQINAAADSIKAEGLKPTSRAIRERLGNVGSMGTIHTQLKRWKAGQERHTATALTLPPALQRAVLDFMDQELAAARATLEVELADQQQEATDLAAENERQADIIEARNTEIEMLSIAQAAAEGKASQLSVDLEREREDAARDRQAAEVARTELAKAQLRLEAMPRLEGDLIAMRAELEKERKARIAAEQSAAVFAAQKDDLSARLVEAKARAERADETLEKLQQRADDLSTQLADSRSAAQAAQQRAETSERELVDAKATVERVGADARAANKEAAELRGQLAATTKPESPLASTQTANKPASASPRKRRNAGT